MKTRSGSAARRARAVPARKPGLFTDALGAAALALVVGSQVIRRSRARGRLTAETGDTIPTDVEEATDHAH